VVLGVLTQGFILARPVLYHLSYTSNQQYIFFFWVELVFELRVLYLQSRSSTTLATLPVYFALVILEMGFHGLFAQAGQTMIFQISGY
jgi:hypothetical protein